MIELTYIDSMGSDLTVVNAARVSFDKESDWDQSSGVPTLFDKDARLIHYLAKHDHWTPFAHCQITVRETVPIFLARQRFRHNVGFVYNEVSRRYVDDEPKFYVPDWRRRAENKKQGSGEPIVGDYDQLSDDIYANVLEVCKDSYNSLIGLGVAPEQARMVLPQSMMTSYYVTGSLPAWARIYKLRSGADAQKEWKALCNSWRSVIRTLFPVSWDALTAERG